MKLWKRAMALWMIAALLLGCLGLAEDMPQEAPAEVEEAIEAASEELVEEAIEAPAGEVVEELVEEAIEVPVEDAVEEPFVEPEDVPTAEPDEAPAEPTEPGDAAAEEPGDADEWPVMLEQLDAGEPVEDEDYEDYNIDEDGVLTSYWGEGKSFVVPDGVTAIGTGAFEKCRFLESVKLPASLTSIELSAFSGCTSLKSMTLAKGLQTIGDFAFSGCTSLKSLTLPEGLESIGYEAFSDCTSLKSVKLPASLTRIGRGAFRNAGLTALTVPGKGVRIYGEAFASCRALKKVKFTGTVEHMGGEDEDDEEAYGIGGVFSECESLSDIRWPDGVSEIPSDTFYNCKSLKNFTIPDTVVKIGENAFCCSGLRKLTVPGSVEEIESWAFEGCSALASIKLSEGLTSIGFQAFSGTSFKSITLPESLVNIDEGALYGLSPDVVLTIPKGSPAEEMCKDLLYHYVYSDGESPIWLTFPNRLEMYEGQTLTKKAKSKAKGDSFTYESFDEDVVTVDSKGKLTAVAVGETIIEVKGKKSGGTARCAVDVLPAVEDILLTSNDWEDEYDYGTDEYKRVSSVTLAIGESIEVLPKYKAEYLDEEGDPYEEYLASGALANMTYSLSKKGVVDVVRGIDYWDYNSGDDAPEYYKDACRITAKKAGSTKITFKTCNGKKASLKITVKKAPKKVSLPKEIVMAVGQTKPLKATLTKGSYSVLEWHADFEEYLDEGLSLEKVQGSWDTVELSAKEEGLFCVTVRTLNGLSAKCDVIVRPEPTELYVPDELLLGQNESYTLEPEVDEDIPIEFYFDCDDPSVATVDGKGKITAKSIGKAEITVTTDCGNLEESVHLIVKAAPTSVMVADGSGKLSSKFTEKMVVREVYSFTPVLSENSSSRLTVKSSKPSVATVYPDPDVPGNYVVETFRKGTAKITIQTFNKKKATITVKVS